MTPGSVVATFVGRLASHRRGNLWGTKRPLRFFDTTMTPPCIDESYAMLALSARHRRMRGEVLDELTNILALATTEWALGDPENPHPREVLQRTLALLWSARLIPRPPCRAYPLGL